MTERFPDFPEVAADTHPVSAAFHDAMRRAVERTSAEPPTDDPAEDSRWRSSVYVGTLASAALQAIATLETQLAATRVQLGLPAESPGPQPAEWPVPDVER